MMVTITYYPMEIVSFGLEKILILKTFFGTIAHEALHAIFSILDIVGIKLSVESEEAFTYLHEYIFNALIWDDKEE